MAEDIFDLEVHNSAPRFTANAAGPISLSELATNAITVPEDYRTSSLRLPQSNYDGLIRVSSRSLAEHAVMAGYSQNIETALNEAIMNAHQHGNRLKPDKEVLIHWKIGSDEAIYLVEDQGGILVPEFAAYVLLHRQVGNNKIPDFYAFSGRSRAEANLGTGTKFMHIYMDVGYFKSDKGGLVVKLRKQAGR